MKKRILSYLVVTTMIFALMSAFSFTASAAEISATTNKYTYIRMAPYWTAEVVDNLTSGYTVTILEREYEYLYIQYTKGGEIRRGYMPKADTSATGYSWCQHNQYHSGYNSTSYAQTVYYRPGGDDCGTIDANEGEVNTKPLLVLHVKDGYAFIQYVTNPTNDGSSHVLFKRGWVPTSVIGYINSTYPSEINKDRFYYIKNVKTGKYLDLASYSAGNVDGGNIHIWDFHGGYNQEWSFKKVPSGSSTYVKLVTNQGTQQRVIRVAEKTAVVGNSAELYTQSSPSKEQEFVLEKGSDGYYQIKARCGSNFMVLGVNPSDSGTGGDVYLRYPYTDDANSKYNKWEIIPAYREDVEYKYWDYQLSSDIDNGVSVSFDLSNIREIKQIGSTKFNLRDYCRASISSWNYPNSKITVSENDSSLNKVYWVEDEYKDPTNSYPYGLADSDVNRFDITLYFGNMLRSYSEDDLEKVWKSTFSHEIGHTLGLDHPPYGFSETEYNKNIMFHGRDRTTLIAPTTVDIAAVKKNYSSK